MSYRVTLTFVVDVPEAEAWDIADGLEQAAMSRNFRECNGYVTAMANARGLVPEGQQAPVTPAESVVRRQGAPMGFGGEDGTHMITLGGEDGRSG